MLLKKTATILGLILAGTTLSGAAPQTISPAIDRPARVSVTTIQHKAGALTIEARDLTPRFLDFYERAQGMDADRRFIVWKSAYGFAAVPPGPQADGISRRLLDTAWPRYAAAIPTIGNGLAPHLPTLIARIQRAEALLGHTAPATIRLTGFVGAFENNAFTAIGADGVPVIALPVEADPAYLAQVTPHEAAHAFHAQLAGFAPGYERTLARLVVEEGIAMHVAQAVSPHLPDRAYTEHRKGWHDTAMRRSCKIIRGIQPVLAARDQPTLFRYTIGTGTTGLEREAYAAGWVLVGEMLRSGRTLREIARIPEDQLVGLLGQAISAGRCG